MLVRIDEITALFIICKDLNAKFGGDCADGSYGFVHIA